MRVTHAADVAGKHTETIRRWIREGKLRATFNEATKEWEIAEEDLAAFLREGNLLRALGPIGKMVDLSAQMVMKGLNDQKEGHREEIMRSVRPQIQQNEKRVDELRMELEKLHEERARLLARLRDAGIISM